MIEIETESQNLLPLRAGIQERYYQLSAPTDGSGEGGKTIRVVLGFDLTDMGNAERLVAYYGHDIRYCAELKEWYLWKSSHWVLDDKLYIWELARETVKRIHYEALILLEDGTNDVEQKKVNNFAYASQSHARIKAMIQLAQADPRIAVSADEFDANPYLLSCTTGTIDYLHCPREKPWREHRRGDLITQFTPRNYNVHANGYHFFDTIFGALPVPSVFFTQDSMGYTSVHVFKHKIFWYAYGVPDGRKNSVIDPFFKALGDYGGAVAYETIKKGYEEGGTPRADIIDLNKQRGGQVSELPKKFVINDAFMKSATSATTKRARGLYKTHGQDVEVRTKFWVDSNFPAKIDFEDEANFNRLAVLIFNRRLPKWMIDEEMLNFLRTDQETLDAVFTFMVDGAYEFMEHGLVRPPEVDAASKQYQKMMNPLNWFKDEYCLKINGGKVPAKTLFERFKLIAETMPKEMQQSIKDELRGVKSFGKSFKQICDGKKMENGWNYLDIALPVEGPVDEDDDVEDSYMERITDDNDYYGYHFRKPPCTVQNYKDFRKTYSESSLSSLPNLKELRELIYSTLESVKANGIAEDTTKEQLALNVVAIVQRQHNEWKDYDVLDYYDELAGTFHKEIIEEIVRS